MTPSPNPDLVLARAKHIFSVLDDDPEEALRLSADTRAKTAHLTAAPVSDQTALAGIHKARIMAQLHPPYAVSEAMALASRAWLYAHGFKDRNGR